MPTARLGADDLGHYRPQLLRFAMLRLRDPAQAEDVVQDALVAAIEGIDRFTAGSSLRTWLTGILKHKIVDCLRSAGREHWLERDNDADAAAPWGDPEEALSRRNFFQVLERFMEELPGKAARVFVLRDVLGMNTAEVCGELGISPDYCSVLLYRARMRLRQRLEPDWSAACGPGA